LENVLLENQGGDGITYEKVFSAVLNGLNIHGTPNGVIIYYLC
jgi:hypothetical protein